MTAEQIEDEFTKKRKIDNLSREAADYASRAAALYDELRRTGLNPTAAMKEIFGHIHTAKPELVMSLASSIGFSAESVRLALTGASRDGLTQHLATMAAIEGVKLTVRDEDGYVVEDPGPDAIRDAFIRKSPHPPSWATIQRLFKENPSPLPDQAPAIACGVMLRGVPMTLEGALSETPEGGLRLLSRGPAIPGGGVSMVEQFFDYEDVMVVAVQRRVTVDEPRIIRS